MDLKTVIESATPEQRQRAFQCKSADEFKRYAKDENIDLSAEDVAELFAEINKNIPEKSATMTWTTLPPESPGKADPSVVPQTLN